MTSQRPNQLNDWQHSGEEVIAVCAAVTTTDLFENLGDQGSRLGLTHNDPRDSIALGKTLHGYSQRLQTT